MSLSSVALPVEYPQEERWMFTNIQSEAIYGVCSKGVDYILKEREREGDCSLPAMVKMYAVGLWREMYALFENVCGLGSAPCRVQIY